jgi:hypothetical protein
MDAVETGFMDVPSIETDPDTDTPDAGFPGGVY